MMYPGMPEIMLMFLDFYCIDSTIQASQGTLIKVFINKTKAAIPPLWGT